MQSSAEASLAPCRGPDAHHPGGPRQLGRRAFLRHGTLLLAQASLTGTAVTRLLSAQEHAAAPELRIGLLTDLHHAHRPPRGTRHYRETLTKLAEATARFRRDQPHFVVELGDLIDAADSVQEELLNLARVQEELSTVPGTRHYVLGNHCVSTLTKDEFLRGVGQPESYYSFDAGDHHFVVLDACFRADGEPYGRNNFHWTDANIPDHQLEWLREDLARTPLRTMVFAHQRLDVDGPHGVRNAPSVRQVLERSGKVLAVFQGHSHQNDYREIGGIHYCTLVAMVEGSGERNNGYAVLDVLPGGVLRLTGFRRQQSLQWRYEPPGAASLRG